MIPEWAARIAEAALSGFIGGVAVCAVTMWAFRGRIRAAMARRRQP